MSDLLALVLESVLPLCIQDFLASFDQLVGKYDTASRHERALLPGELDVMGLEVSEVLGDDCEVRQACWIFYEILVGKVSFEELKHRRHGC